MPPDTEVLKKIGDAFFGKDKYMTNVMYWGERGPDYPIGELDLYGFIDGTLYILEYKGNGSHKKKAIDQLLRAEKYATIYEVPYVLAYAHGDGKGGCEVEFVKYHNGKKVTLDRTED